MGRLPSAWPMIDRPRLWNVRTVTPRAAVGRFASEFLQNRKSLELMLKCPKCCCGMRQSLLLDRVNVFTGRPGRIPQSGPNNSDSRINLRGRLITHVQFLGLTGQLVQRTHSLAVYLAFVAKQIA